MLAWKSEQQKIHPPPQVDWPKNQWVIEMIGGEESPKESNILILKNFFGGAGENAPNDAPK